MRRIIGGVGRGLVTVGILILLFVAYQLWGTGIYESRQQSHLQSQFRQEQARERARARAAAAASATTTTRPQVPPPIGNPIGIIQIPKIGLTRAIVQGIGVEDLRKGPGHYPATPLPGQLGNAAIAGHRTTYGAPFNRLDEVKPGDPIIIETQTSWYVYRETNEMKVSPSALWVTYPVPNHLGQTPTQRLLTFTTCNPKYSARQRLILFAHLVSAQPKTAGPPPELATGA
jgi:sortase A